MSRKLFITILALIILLCGTATAAVNGVFYGYPIVKVKVNGNVITGDTPAIIFNGRTLVPLAFVSNALGATVAWENSTQTAIVTTNNNSSNNSADVSTVKYYSYVSYRYNELATLGSLLLFEADKLPSDSEGKVSYDQNDFNNSVMVYKGYVSNNAAFISDAANKGISVDDTKVILNKYLDCLNNLNTAYSYLADYSSTKDVKSFSSYLTYLDKARISGETGHQMAWDGYTKYYNLVQNY